MCAEVFLAGWKHNGDESEEEYCWAITRAAVWSWWGRSGFWLLQFGLKMDFLIHIYIYIYIYIARQKVVCLYTQLRLSKIRLEPDLLERNHCVQKVSVCVSSRRSAQFSNFKMFIFNHSDSSSPTGCSFLTVFTVGFPALVQCEFLPNTWLHLQ